MFFFNPERSVVWVVAGHEGTFHVSFRYWWWDERFQDNWDPGHLLLIPYRHIPGLFDATDAEQAALLALVREAKALLDEQFHPDGYNIGVNVGKAAGQTVMHLHVHVIPRYAGDVDDPRGGVRGVIPERRKY